jgi:uncharacterized membrane protein (DUF485 family)
LVPKDRTEGQPAQLRNDMGGRMARNEAGLEAAQAAVQSLIAAKLRFLVPMTIIFMVGYIGLTVIAGFAKGLMGVKIVGPLNLGFALIEFNYALSWVLALVYERIANRIFDPRASRAAASSRRSAP